MKSQMATTVSVLGVYLPSYMLPTMIPRSTSRKLDGKTLTRSATSLSKQVFVRYTLADVGKRPMETDTERHVGHLARYFDSAGASSILRDDSFLRTGRDSVSAIHVATAGLEMGITPTMHDNFSDTRLLVVATEAVNHSEDQEENARESARGDFQVLFLLLPCRSCLSRHVPPVMPSSPCPTSHALVVMPLFAMFFFAMPSFASL